MAEKNKIREIREARGLSQEDLAQALNTFNQQISHLELGKRRLTWEWMMRIAGVLECHPTDLVAAPAPEAMANPAEAKLLDDFRRLSAREQRTVRTMASHMAESKTPYGSGVKSKKKK